MKKKIASHLLCHFFSLMDCRLFDQIHSMYHLDHFWIERQVFKCDEHEVNSSSNHPCKTSTFQTSPFKLMCLSPTLKGLHYGFRSSLMVKSMIQGFWYSSSTGNQTLPALLRMRIGMWTDWNWGSGVWSFILILPWQHQLTNRILNLIFI